MRIGIISRVDWLRRWGCVGVILSALFPGKLGAAVLPVANPSFELPSTAQVALNVESWRKIPKPDWFEETPLQSWEQLIAVFLDSSLVNVHGRQALHLHAVPEVGMFQDLVANEVPVMFEPGLAYRCKFALVGGRGNMKEGVTLRVALYYRNSEGDQVPVGQTTITNSSSVFTNLNELVEVTMDVGPVKPEDPWAGKPMGILFLSTVPLELSGGYWDIDNVRLTSIANSPAHLTFARQGNNLRISWWSDPSKRYRLQTTTALSEWMDRGDFVSGTGEEMSQLIPLAEREHLFVRLQEVEAE